MRTPLHSKVATAEAAVGLYVHNGDEVQTSEVATTHPSQQ